MTALECAREQDLLDALVSGRWPARCEPALRAHVDGCAICRDTLAVALPLLIDGEAAYAAAQVPSSGVVWWRAQMRARREAERIASRPITIVQAIALACGTALTIALVWLTRSALPNWPDWLRRLDGSVAGAAASLTSSVTTVSPWGFLPWAILGISLLLLPLAIYLALANDDAR